MSIFLRFNLIVITIFIAAFILGEIRILFDIRDKVDSEIQMTAKIMDYLVDARLSEMRQNWAAIRPAPTSDAQLKSLFELQNLRDMPHLNIEFISTSGALIDSNRSIDQNLPDYLPQWLTQLLTEYLVQEPITSPVTIAGQPLGNIVISTNVNSELIDIWAESNRIFFPLIMGFFLACFFIAGLASMILRPADRMLLQYRQIKNSSKSSKHRSWFNIKQFLTVNKEFEAVTLQLENHYQQLVTLNEKMLQLQEQERKQLSADLHDEIGQHITALRFDIASLKAADEISDIQNIVNDIDIASLGMVDTIRTTLQRLRPPALEKIGLVGSLRELTNQWQLRYQQHKLYFQLNGDYPMVVDELIELTVYRIIQECLTNISRHAGERVIIRIALTFEDEAISLSVKDDGKGFDQHKMASGYGITGMQERVESVGGTMQLMTEYNSGTTLTFHLPLMRE